jgi:phosphoglycerate dehydrogenase-like enzyme
LWQAPGLLLTPHVGGAIYESRERAYKVVSEQLARLAAGQPLLNVIGDRGY